MVILETPIYKKLKANVKKSKKAEHNLSKREANLLQQDANNKATIKSSQNSIDLINKDLAYTWKKVTNKVKKGNKTIEKTEKKWTKRPKPALPNKAQSRELAQLKSSLSSAQSKQEKLLKSGDYKRAKTKMKKLKKRTAKATKALNSYQNKRKKKAQKSIKGKVKAQNSDFLAPKATLYETEGTSGTVVFIFATNENEDNESTITSYPVDHDENVTDHVQNGDKTLTVEGRLQGHTAGADVSASQLYNQMLDWRFHGTELTYKSNGSKKSQTLNIAHVYNKHFHIQSLQKTQDQALIDTVKFSMTLKFVYRPKISGSKSKVNNKGKMVKIGKYHGAKTITGKRGKTMYDYAKKYHTSVKNLISMNKNKHYTAKTNLSGKKLKVSESYYNASYVKKPYIPKYNPTIKLSDFKQLQVPEHTLTKADQDFINNTGKIADGPSPVT